VFFNTTFLKKVLEGLFHHSDIETCSLANIAHTAQFLGTLRLKNSVSVHSCRWKLKTFIATHEIFYQIFQHSFSEEELPVHFFFWSWMKL
jgi:hypothetical protein